VVVSLTSLGGARTVTGSKHLLEHDGMRILVDCGMFQGLRELRDLNWRALPVPASSIDAVILTHAHLDHSGYLPRLLREGFKGPIFATPATIDVAKLILLDSAFLQEKDADFANRHGFSRHEPALPLYTTRDAQAAIDAFRPVDFHEQRAHGSVSLLFRRAGHILGAATAEVHVGGITVVFSGDLGRYGDAMMPDPEPVPSADYLVVESTYGNRIHDASDPAAVLLEVIERTVARGGTVVIPAFAIGRAQSLLHQIWTLRQRGKLRHVPVYVDSPMATSATDLLCVHKRDHRLEEGVCRDVCESATYVRSVEESKRLTASRMPKVIISASGMMSGGRVLHHVKAFGPDPRSSILLAGYQAAGTRGRALAEGARELKIHGRLVDIRAEVADVPALSAHADANEILRWLSGFERAPTNTFIVHGESEAAEGLEQRIMRQLGWQCVIPSMNEHHLLPGGPAEAEGAQGQSCEAAHGSAKIEEAGLESFPASDPPAWTLGEEHTPCKDRK
jgi:metallo-beta-lactamase family protein